MKNDCANTKIEDLIDIVAKFGCQDSLEAQYDTNPKLICNISVAYKAI
jgi:hypothetical protein